jgi:glycosyltransferase involved in cell wall biosynthesis
VHIVFVLPSYKTCNTVDGFWEYGFCQVNQARGLVALGHEVTVISRYSENHDKERDDVKYFFVKDNHSETLRSWQFSEPVIKKLKLVTPDIVHFHGLGCPVFVLRLLLAIRKPTQVFLECHGGTVMRFPINFIQYLSACWVNGLFFPNTQEADEWSARWGLSRDRFHYSIECAPERVMGDRAVARQNTGFSGSPVVLWNSRAIRRRNADIVIDAYERYLQKNDATACHFYMMVPEYEEEVLRKITTMSTRSTLLQKHFTLIVERKPQADMAVYYNSADYIISGSEYDPYGFGVVDAMSCGVIPIVTKSATFQDITNQGSVGLSWNVADPSSLVDAFNQMLSDKDQIARSSREVQSYFCNNLSMAAQGKLLENTYRKAIA